MAEVPTGGARPVRVVNGRQNALQRGNQGAVGLGEVKFDYDTEDGDPIFGSHGHTTKIDAFVIVGSKKIIDGFSNCTVSTLVDSACCRYGIMSTTYGIDTTTSTWSLLSDFLRRNCNPAIYVLSTNEAGGHNVSRHSIHNKNLRSFLSTISASAPAAQKIAVGGTGGEAGVILNGTWVMGVGMTVYTHNVPHTVTEFAQAIVDSTPYFIRFCGKCFSCK